MIDLKKITVNPKHEYIIRTDFINKEHLMSYGEYMHISKLIKYLKLIRKFPKILIFGMKDDCELWIDLIGEDGMILFVEDNDANIEKYKGYVTNNVQVTKYTYDSLQVDYLDHKEQELKLQDIYILSTRWDLVLIDAPTNEEDSDPGRLIPIYTAGTFKNNPIIALHDSLREVEDYISIKYLGTTYMQVEKLRIFNYD